MEYQNVQSLTGHLTWTHICELLIIEDKVNDESDNPPIGIILCAEKDEITAEYIIGGFENNVFASKYVTILPNKEKLIEEVENVMNK